VLGGRAKVPSYPFLSHMGPGPHKSQSEQRAASQLDVGFRIPAVVALSLSWAHAKVALSPLCRAKNIDLNIAPTGQ